MEESGPLVIILCKNFKSGLKIEGHLNNLFSANSRHQILCSLISDDRRETRMKLELGVDVMVTTLSFAAEMIQRNHSHFRFNRYLSYILAHN
jgi:hypothetical protein